MAKEENQEIRAFEGENLPRAKYLQVPETIYLFEMLHKVGRLDNPGPGSLGCGLGTMLVPL